jgi:ribosomal protein S6
MEQSESIKENAVKVYEVGYLLTPAIAEEQVAGEVEKLKATIQKFDGVLITEDFPKLRQLAYTIAKSANGALKQRFDKAYFGWVKFEASATAATNIKTELDKNTAILRLMLITTVRENTMTAPKIAFKEDDKPAKAPDEVAAVLPINEEELNKSIDNLVVES